MLLYQALKDHVKKDRRTEALLYMGKSFDYGKLFDGIDEAAGKLAGLVGAGDVATVCMPNTPECVYIFYALNRLGVVAHMVHPLAPLNMVKKFMAAAKSKILITLSINLEKYAELAKEYKIVYVHPARSLNGLLRFAFDVKVKPYRGDKTGMLDYDALKANPLPLEPTRGDDTAGVYLHSGGTGGEPKIIELSDGEINALAFRGPEALGTSEVRGMYMLGALPMFHGFGLTMCIHAILTFGGVSVLMPKFDPKLTVKLLKKNKMHFMIGVPNLFRALLKQKGFRGDALKNMYVGFVGGDCAPQDLLDEFNGRMEAAGAKGRLFEGYGLTETVTVCAVNNYAHNRRGSMGYMLSDLDAIIVPPDGTEPLADGEKGEIAICGDTVMNGYLDNPQANAEVFFERGGKRYVRTGDFGYKDGDGFLYFIQRLKRIIKISGISVYPKEIEASALELAGVTGACAVEYKDGGKTRIALYLTGEKQDADAVRKKIESDLSRYAVPTIVKTIDALPVTAVMKVDTLALAAMTERELTEAK
ncbi:MAG: class I adenylate-forming enzyme family protein [Clostridia bacterium]|nr:class I adenylate-forming enzyme family protein [Clostridia bacterium]